jgi:hypothetical protein
MTDNKKTKLFDTLLKVYDRLEPYQYFNLSNKASLIGLNQGVFAPEEAKNAFIFHNVVEKAMSDNDIRIVTVDKDMISLIEDTEPNFNLPDIHLPYNPMFINHKFISGDNIIVGVLLVEIDGKISFNTIAGNLTTEREKKLWANLDKNISKEFPPEDWKLVADCVKFTSNLINMMNFEKRNITETQIKTTKEHNEKRAKRGKQPMRDTLFIRLTGKLGQYAKYYSEHRNEISISFLVRGTYRYYESPRYHDDVRFTWQWINPFRKGMNLPDDLKRFVRLK